MKKKVFLLLTTIALILSLVPSYVYSEAELAALNLD